MKMPTKFSCKRILFLAGGLFLVAMIAVVFSLTRNPFYKDVALMELREIPWAGPRFFGDTVSKVAWISDIHADRFKRRTVDSGTIYPKQYEEYVPKVFDAMRSRGIDIVIATGDNLNSGDENYAVELERIAREKHMQVLWVAGNHDSDGGMEVLGIGKDEKYYSKDFKNTRIIVLDSAKITRETGDYLGGIDDEQLKWLRNALKTDKQVIVAMHVPIFSVDLGDAIIERYAEFEKVLRENGNVQIVVSGHFHVPWQKERDGIRYYGQGALTLQDYKGAYAIIDLEKDYGVEYLFAQ